MNDYEKYDALGLAELVRKGDVKPDELLEAALTRAEKHAEIGAIPIPMFEEARESVARGLPEGPFHGVPFLLKDLHILYAGTKTTYGSRMFADNVADHDSELTTRYKRAGLVVFGKSASPEFGLTTSTESTLFGQTRNPWNLERTAGGSSGGASAAVAAGILPAANASDGGGSIRIPASCCGLVGMKPTRARTPMGPDAGEGWSGMSCVHAVSRSVRDNAALLDAVQGPEPGAPYWAPPPERPYLEEVSRPAGRLRIGFQTATFNGAPTHPDCVAATEDAARLCQELGHEVSEAKLAVDVDTLREATLTIIGGNLRATLLTRARALGREDFGADDVEPTTFLMAAAAAGKGAADYADAVRTIHAVGRQVAAFFADVDVLLTPTMATPPLPLGALSLSNPDAAAYVADLNKTVGFTQLFNASGNPAISLPLAWNDEGLPIGLQFAGRFGDEATLFRLAAQLEEARPWFDKTPANGA